MCFVLSEKDVFLLLFLPKSYVIKLELPLWNLPPDKDSLHLSWNTLILILLFSQNPCISPKKRQQEVKWDKQKQQSLIVMAEEQQRSTKKEKGEDEGNSQWSTLRDEKETRGEDKEQEMEVEEAAAFRTEEDNRKVIEEWENEGGDKQGEEQKKTKCRGRER